MYVCTNICLSNVVPFVFGNSEYLSHIHKHSTTPFCHCYVTYEHETDEWGIPRAMNRYMCMDWNACTCICLWPHGLTLEIGGVGLGQIPNLNGFCSIQSVRRPPNVPVKTLHRCKPDSWAMDAGAIWRD